MKMAFRSEARVPAAPERVWDVLTDWSRAPEWMRSVSRVEPIVGESGEPTSALRFESRGGIVESRVEAWEPSRLLSLSSTQGGVTARYDYRLEPVETGTCIVLEARCSSEGVLWTALSPLIRLAMWWTDGRQPEALGRLLEEAA